MSLGCTGIAARRARPLLDYNTRRQPLRGKACWISTGFFSDMLATTALWYLVVIDVSISTATRRRVRDESLDTAMFGLRQDYACFLRCCLLTMSLSSKTRRSVQLQARTDWRAVAVSRTRSNMYRRIRTLPVELFCSRMAAPEPVDRCR